MVAAGERAQMVVPRCHQDDPVDHQLDTLEAVSRRYSMRGMRE